MVSASAAAWPCFRPTELLRGSWHASARARKKLRRAALFLLLHKRPNLFAHNTINSPLIPFRLIHPSTGKMAKDGEVVQSKKVSSPRRQSPAHSWSKLTITTVRHGHARKLLSSLTSSRISNQLATPSPRRRRLSRCFGSLCAVLRMWPAVRDWGVLGYRRSVLTTRLSGLRC